MGQRICKLVELKKFKYRISSDILVIFLTLNYIGNILQYIATIAIVLLGAPENGGQ